MKLSPTLDFFLGISELPSLKGERKRQRQAKRETETERDKERDRDRQTGRVERGSRMKLKQEGKENQGLQRVRTDNGSRFSCLFVPISGRDPPDP